MTNLCTKVTVRKRPIKNGQLSLYLDFYPAYPKSQDWEIHAQGISEHLYLCQPQGEVRTAIQ